MTFALIAVLAFLCVWCYDSAKHRENIQKGRNATRTNVELERQIREKYIKRINELISYKESPPIEFEKVEEIKQNGEYVYVIDGKKVDFLRPDALDFMLKLYEQCDIPLFKNTFETVEQMNERIKKDREEWPDRYCFWSHVEIINIKKGDFYFEQYGGVASEYSYYPSGEISYKHPNGNFEIEIGFGTKPIGRLQPNGTLYNTIIGHITTRRYYTNLICHLVTRELATHGYVHSPDGIHESEWQEEEKNRKIKDDFKDKYPWFK